MASKKIRIRDSSDNLQRQIDVDDTSKNTAIYDSSDTKIMEVEAHASRHEYGGADAIATDGLHFTQIDKSLGTETSVSIAGSSTSVISKGAYYVRADSGVNVEYSTDGGTTWVALSIPCFIVSDGSNVRFNNTNTAAANGYLTPISS